MAVECSLRVKGFLVGELPFTESLMREEVTNSS